MSPNPRQSWNLPIRKGGSHLHTGDSRLCVLFLGRLLPKVSPPHVHQVHVISWEELVNQKANLLSRRCWSGFPVQGTDFPRRGLSESRPLTPTPWVTGPGNRLACVMS